MVTLYRKYHGVVMIDIVIKILVWVEKWTVIAVVSRDEMLEVRGYVMILPSTDLIPERVSGPDVFTLVHIVADCQSD